ncbi:MAG: anhydro-N-acetylmuramic acid kinase [Gammaproteobacteria bacterium]
MSIPKERGARAIGLMSGTSLDGIDGVLLAMRPPVTPTPVTPAQCQWAVEASAHLAYPDDTRAALEALCLQSHVELDQLGRLDGELGAYYARVANQLLQKTRAGIAVIGCHGQTIRHRPDGDFPFTLQLGNGALIARRTGLPVVTDFRRADMAAGGQGAPLAPAFHHAAFADAAEHRAVLNLGGIANLTHLPAGGAVRGFDTGPANTLLDHWCKLHFDAPFDRDGAHAAAGTPRNALLDALLADPYFARPPPKSTGREYFHADWLAHVMARRDLAGVTFAREDVLATLTALTAESVARQLRELRPYPRALYVCGGGARNRTLLAMLAARYDGAVRTTRELGLAPQWVEAAAFAWMALRTMRGRASTLPSVTGASAPCVAGVIHYPQPVRE